MNKKHLFVYLSFLQLIVSCWQPYEPQKLEYLQVDCLPSFNFGKTLQWNVTTDTKTFHRFEGTESWFVGLVESDQNIKTYHIASSRNGKYSYHSNNGWVVWDSVKNLVRNFVIKDSMGTVIIPLEEGAILKFKRYYDVVAGGVKEIAQRNMIGGRLDSSHIVVKQGNGLVEFHKSFPVNIGTDYNIYHYFLKDSYTNSKIGNYFPELKIGETSNWEFYQSENLSRSGETLKGKTKWVISAIKEINNVKEFTVAKIFTGFAYEWSYSKGGGDTTKVDADTSYFTIKDDSKIITINVESSSKNYFYWGKNAEFERYQPESYGDEITFEPLWYTVFKFRKDYGLFSFERKVDQFRAPYYRYKRIE